MTEQEILEVIEEAAKDGRTELNLAGEGMEVLPKEIGQLTNLTWLCLSYNHLSSLPAELGELRNLTRLDLDYNHLSSVPAEMGHLTNLTKLDLHNNQLSSVPAELGELRNLRELYLFNNELLSVPMELCRLRNLRELYLSNNQLSSVPMELGQLRNLTHLYLSNNQLSSVPEKLGQLTNLTELDLANNQLSSVPVELGQLTSLSSLDLRSNWISELGRWIVGLGLVIKGERVLGDEVWGVLLEGNPLESPPVEVVQRGTEAVQDYFRQLDEVGKDRLYEAKLLIVGEAGAGKSSLARKIENPKYKLKKKEKSTEGIDVIEWHFDMQDGEDFRVNIWDFGGQEIYHATHQFFLTKRSLYALVADDRKEDTDFNYWLNIVELLSEGSPILIVKNEKQDRHREINESALRGQFENIKEFLATNLATNRGLDEIKGEIRHQISRLPHVGSELPRTWVKVREALEKDERNYIGVGQYFKICDENGFKLEKDKLQLSGYLHDLGVCLHFQEDVLLKETVILKPEWGTDAVYKVLDDKEVVGNKGKFTQQDAERIWHEEKYEGMHAELLQLMMKFKLCYEIKGTGEYIAPELLGRNKPEYDWDEAENLIIRYTYEFMPKGIITQLIVAMHASISDQKLVWREGVILEKDGTKAEVIESYGRREIKIRVAGKHKKEVMTIVTYELDRIHDTYKRLKYSKWIPCNCEVCKGSQGPHFYAYEKVREFIDEGQAKIQCQKKPYRMVDVIKLVDDVVKSGKRDVGSEVFISYSHKDRKWLERLQTHLRPRVRDGRLSVWADTDMRAGDKWRDEIERAISQAEVAVLLVSPDFLASDFIAEKELPPLLEAAERNGLRVVWIPISASGYDVTEIGDYQAAWDPGRPLDGLSGAERNEALVEICERIEEACGGGGN